MPTRRHQRYAPPSYRLLEPLEPRRLLSAGTLRIVCYNLDADTTDFANQSAPLETVLEGIGAIHLSDNGTPNAQPIDLLAVEELHNSEGDANSPTLSSITANLNTTYGTNAYAFDPTTDPTTGDTLGNGPSGLIYNTATIQVLSATALGTPSGSAEARAPMEYHLHMVGEPSADDFYLIVSHAKSGTTSSDQSRRAAEATVIANAIASLGASAHVIAVGDFNITAGSAEAAYQTLIGSLDDVANPSDSWSDATTAEEQAIAPLLSESATSVNFRDDIQFVSPSADPASSSKSSGLQYDAGSILVFGNGGASTIVNHAVTDTTNNPGALSDLSNKSTVLTALTQDTDHLPVVADYSIVNPTNTPSVILGWNVTGQTSYGTQDLTATTVAAGVTNSVGLTRASGLTTSGTAATNAWGATNWNNTSAAGISGNQFLTFGLTVNAGQTLSLSSIDLNYRRSSSGPANGLWQYQLNGSTWLPLGDFANEFSSTSTSGAAMTEINLANLSDFQSLPSGTTLNFRLIPYGATATSGTFYVFHKSTNDLTLSGIVTTATTMSLPPNVTLVSGNTPTTTTTTPTTTTPQTPPTLPPPAPHDSLFQLLARWRSRHF